MIHMYMYFTGHQPSQTQQNTFHPPPRRGGLAPSLSQRPQQSNMPSFSYSISSSRGVASSSSSVYTASRGRNKTRAFSDYNDQGRPRSKRARMSAVEDADDDFEDEEVKSRSNMFISARDQHVSQHTLL